MARFGHKPIEQLVEFRDSSSSPSGKTRIFVVQNPETKEYQGTIKWHGPWRKYVFYPDENSFYDHDFLQYVGQFLEQRTWEHMHK